MFKLNKLDKEKFAHLERFWSGVVNHHLSGQEFSAAIHASNLEKHLAAHSFAAALLKENVNLDNEKHQRVLGLALAAQQKPETWRQYTQSEQREIVNLLGVKYASEKRQREQPLFKILDCIFDIRSIGDISAGAAAVGGNNPYVLGVTTGINILVGRLAGGSSFVEGANLEVVENLDKLDSGDIFESGIKLQPDALQFVTKKHQNSLDNIKQVLQAYGLKFEELGQTQREQVRKLYASFFQKGKETDQQIKREAREIKEQIERLRAENQAERKLQREKEAYYKRLEEGRSFFRGLQGVAALIKDPKLQRNLQVVGHIGEQGINIAGKAMELGGLVPGVAAPTGMAMLLPMANIAVAAASIIFSLIKKRKQSENSPLGEALKTISKQIAELRKEMHERFDLVDQQLKQIYENLIEGFEQIQAIITFESGVLREMIQISVGRLQEDIDELTRITESGHKELALVSYRDQVFEPINSYIEGISTGSLDSTKLVILEKNWLLGQFCTGLFAGKYFRKDQPYHQVAKIASKNVEFILGYLAQFAREKLDIKGIKDIDLPSLDLWMEGIGLAIAARTCFKLKDNKEIPLEHLRAIREKAASSYEFLTILRQASPTLYAALFSLYFDGLAAIEKKIVELLTAKAKREAATDTVAVSSIKLSVVRPVPGQSDPKLAELNGEHLLKALGNIRVPAILVFAEQLGFGQWEANYKADRKDPQAFHDDPMLGPWHVRTRRKPAKPIYHVQLNFRINEKEVIPILNTSFIREFNDTSWEVHGKESCKFDGGPVCDQYRQTQGRIPLSTLVNKNWTSSTICTAAVFVEGYQEVVAQHTASIINLVWQNAKTLDPTVDHKLSQEQKAFLEAVRSLKGESALLDSMVEQLKAVRSLSIAYAEVIGFSQECRDEIASILNVDLARFLNTPHLVTKTRELISNQLIGNLSKLPDLKNSRIFVKLGHAINMIDMYEKHLKEGIVAKDRLPDASLNAQFIDWSKIEIEKDEQGHDVCLGKGGFGTVFKGRWNTENGVKPVAIKIINTDMGDENSAFKAEIERLSKLYSPHIVHSQGYSRKDGRLCLVMELAKKGSMDKLLADKETKLSSEQEVTWVMQIARGLQYLHRNGIIHGDIKSLNVLLDDNLNAKLNDFGLATTTLKVKQKTVTQSSRRSFGKSKSRVISSALESTQAFGGSLLWQPPEAVTLDVDRLKPLSFEGDVYSLGVVIWEIFSRSLPFEAYLKEHDSGFRIRMGILGDLEKSGKKLQRQDIDKIPDRVPEVIREIIASCWQRNPANRPTIDLIVNKLNQAFPNVAKRLDEMSANHGKVKEESKGKREEGIESPAFADLLAQYRRLFNKEGSSSLDSLGTVSSAGVSTDVSTGIDGSGNVNGVKNGTYHKALPVLRGVMPGTNKPIFFNEFNAERDGSCGFYSLGISRVTCVKELGELANQLSARQFLADEIMQEITGVVTGGKVAGSVFSGDVLAKAQGFADAYNKMSVEKAILEGEIRSLNLSPGGMTLESDALVTTLQSLREGEGVLKQLLDFKKRYAELNNTIRGFCEEEQTYRNYVNQLRPEVGAWLGINAAILLAKKMHFNLYVWYKTSDPSKVVCNINNSHYDSANVNTYHLLHTDGATHFNLLAEPTPHLVAPFTPYLNTVREVNLSKEVRSKAAEPYDAGRTGLGL